MILQSLLSHFSTERVGWFGAGLSAAALGVVGYQFVLASFLSGALPGLQATPTLTPSPSPSPTHTTRPTATPWPTPTPRPTRTPTPRPTHTPTRTPPPTPTPAPTRTPTPAAGLIAPDVLATMATQDPASLAAAVATFASRAADVLQSLPTARPR